MTFSQSTHPQLGISCQVEKYTFLAILYLDVERVWLQQLNNADAVPICELTSIKRRVECESTLHYYSHLWPQALGKVISSELQGQNELL